MNQLVIDSVPSTMKRKAQLLVSLLKNNPNVSWEDDGTVKLCSMFCCTLLYVHSSIAIILMGKRQLIALLNLSSWCLVMVERLFLAVPLGCLQFVIVVFPDHTHLLFFMANLFQGLILLIWLMMSLDIVKAVNLQVGKLLQKV